MTGKHVSTTPEDIFAGTRQEDTFLGSPSSSISEDPLETRQAVDLAQHNVEPNIFSKYREIKNRNEMLKTTAYTQFWN